MNKSNSNSATKIQSYWRSYNSRKNNIYSVFRSKAVVEKCKKEIIGYHIINNEPIKEAPWEEINCNIVAGVCAVSDEANGNHKSGKDNRFNNWNISNKTAKIAKSNVNISSYRLSSVCNSKECGDIKKIVKEIELRDSSFDYYSILLREHINSNIIYKWCIIPKDYYIFSPTRYTWDKKYGKQGSKKGLQVGWQSKYMDITFSMSSQLWFHFKIKDIEKYIICEVNVDPTTLPKLTYSQIYDTYLDSSKRPLAKAI
jgi:hypothetical protein